MKLFRLLIFVVALFSNYLGFSQPQDLVVEYRHCENCGSQFANCNSNVNAPVNDSENTNYTYGNSHDYATNQVTSDYGPRRLSANRPYDWHGGIDFSSAAGDTDRGDLIIALRGGDVHLRGLLTNRTKFVVIDNANDNIDFGYLHMFRRYQLYFMNN